MFDIAFTAKTKKHLFLIPTFANGLCLLKCHIRDLQVVDTLSD